METENWEEIGEWDVDEDVELAKRITVTSVNPNLGIGIFSASAIKAANNGIVASNSINSAEDSDEMNEEDEVYEYIEAHKKATFANILKGNTRQSNKITSSVLPTTTTTTTTTSKEKRKKQIFTNRKEDTGAEGLGDHECNCLEIGDPFSPTENEEKKSRSSRVRENIVIAKQHNRQLYGRLISKEDVEASLSRGDTNRNRQFVEMKAAKKAMKSKKRLKDAK
ncbi:hypothetical protein G9A89_003110 [Geosiphon pyriformis]|nr:hypothetical protein G9A89_003110 [Geosiphon pyriformis]